MPEFATDTGAIYYEVIEATEPAGPEVQTLTLLHNFMSSGRAAWGPLLAELSKPYRLLLPDLPGHCGSLLQWLQARAGDPGHIRRRPWALHPVPSQ